MSNSEPINLGVLGASGRAGQEVVRALKDFPNFNLRRAIVGPESAVLGRMVPCGGNLVYESIGAEVLTGVQLWIDFSTAEGSLELLSKASGVPLVILTTGHGSSLQERVQSYAKTAPVLICPNASLGVFAAKAAAKRVQEILGGRFEIEISEIHHRGKVDAPSGTALDLGAALVDSSNGELLYGSKCRKGRRKSKEIGIASLRGGDVVGEHTIYFLGDGERVEITHRASDRGIFARGALVLGERLVGRGPGLYRAEDLF